MQSQTHGISFEKAKLTDHRDGMPGTNVLVTTWHTPTGWVAFIVDGVRASFAL